MVGKRAAQTVIIYIVIFSLAAIAALIGSLSLINYQKQLEGKVVVQAEVKSLLKDSRYDESENIFEDIYAEVAEYTVDGKKYTAKNSVYSNTPKRVGEKIKIAYDPQNPSDCIFVESNKLFILVPFIFCGVFVLIGIGKIIFDLKNRGREGI